MKIRRERVGRCSSPDSGHVYSSAMSSLTFFPSSPAHMYIFEGTDYSKIPSMEDGKRFELMLGEQPTSLEDTGKEGRSLRHKTGVSPLNFPKNILTLT